MSAFNFSLQQVLDLRVHQRKEVEQTLAKIREQRRDLEAQMRQLDRGFEQSLQTPAPTQTDLADLRRLAAHRDSTREKRSRLADRLEQIRQKEETARRELIEKKRAEEALESLYEDERQTHTEKEARLNQQLLDEQAISQHIRQNPLRG